MNYNFYKITILNKYGTISDLIIDAVDKTQAEAKALLQYNDLIKKIENIQILK